MRSLKAAIGLVLVAQHLSSHTALGQNCKNVSDNIDKYTNARSISTPTVKFIDMTKRSILRSFLNSNDDNPDWELLASFNMASNRRVMTFTHLMAGRTGSVSGIDRVDIKLANDSLITLTRGTIRDAQESGNASWMFTFFDLDDTAIDLLRTSNIKFMRVFFSYQPRDPVVEAAPDDKKASEFKNYAACFAAKLSIQPRSQASANPGVNSLSPDIPAGPAPAPSVAVTTSRIIGSFFRTGHGVGDYLAFGNEGVFAMKREGVNYVGTYALQQDSLILTTRAGQKFNARVIGSSIADADGSTWQRIPVQAAAAQPGTMTVDQVIQMLTAKLPDDVIISAVKKAGGLSGLSPDNLIRLKSAGASDAILRAVSQ